MISVKLAEQASSVALVGAVGYAAALYQLLKTALKQTAAAIDKIGAAVGELQPSPVARAHDRGRAQQTLLR